MTRGEESGVRDEVDKGEGSTPKVPTLDREKSPLVPSGCAWPVKAVPFAGGDIDMLHTQEHPVLAVEGIVGSPEELGVCMELLSEGPWQSTGQGMVLVKGLVALNEEEKRDLALAMHHVARQAWRRVVDKRNGVVDVVAAEIPNPSSRRPPGNVRSTAWAVIDVEGCIIGVYAEESSAKRRALGDSGRYVERVVFYE
jgi:hypothetical protein